MRGGCVLIERSVPVNVGPKTLNNDYFLDYTSAVQMCWFNLLFLPFKVTAPRYFHVCVTFF